MNTTTQQITLTKELAQLICDGLAGTGWLDDADENLAYIVEDEGKEAAEKKMAEVNDLILLINPLLDEPLNIIDEDLDTYWLTCPHATSTIDPVMNIETLIELLLVAKSKGVTQVTVVDPDAGCTVIDSVGLDEKDGVKKVTIQVSSNWWLTCPPPTSNIDPVMIKTTTLHTINTTEENLKKNFYSSYLDILTDGLKDDIEYFEHDVHRLSSAIQDIEKLGFTELFKEGYTMMLLDPNYFNFVDEWFNKDGSAEENLQIVITKKNGQVELVSDKDLSYWYEKILHQWKRSNSYWKG